MVLFAYAIIIQMWPRKNDLLIICSNVFLYVKPHSRGLKGHLPNQGSAICGAQ